MITLSFYKSYLFLLAVFIVATSNAFSENLSSKFHGMVIGTVTDDETGQREDYEECFGSG